MARVTKRMLSPQVGDTVINSCGTVSIVIVGIEQGRYVTVKYRRPESDSAGIPFAWDLWEAAMRRTIKRKGVQFVAAPNKEAKNNG